MSTDRVKKLYDAMANLCQLKSYKDTVGKDDFYEREQPQAWKVANECLNEMKDVLSTTSVEPVDKNFYCKEWNNVGYVCEEQCAACKKHDQPTPEEMAVDYEAEAKRLYPFITNDEVIGGSYTVNYKIRELQLAHIRARQMSVPTNDQMEVLQDVYIALREQRIMPEMCQRIKNTIDKATELLSQQKEMDGKVTRGKDYPKPLVSFLLKTYGLQVTEQEAFKILNDTASVPDITAIDPLKAREIAEKAFDAGNDFYTMDEYQETKQQYLDTHYPIEKEGDDKADNQE